MVAINGGSSPPLRRKGAKMKTLISQPSTAPAISATAMLMR
jgi:hypothetical protein